MKQEFVREWVLPVGLGMALAFAISVVVVHVTICREIKEIQNEMCEFRTELKKRGEYIGFLSARADALNAKAAWLLAKIDKRRVLIPVLDGTAYKIVEIEADLEQGLGISGLPTGREE